MTNNNGIDTDEIDRESYDMAKELVEREELNQCVTSENIDFVFSVIKKEAPHDKQSIKQLYLGMLSAFTKGSYPSCRQFQERRCREVCTFWSWWPDICQRSMSFL